MQKPYIVQFYSYWISRIRKSIRSENSSLSPLDCKETQPVHPKWDQFWMFIGRTDAEAETPILWPLHEELTHWKRPWCWEGLEAGEEGDNRGWDGWMASPTGWTWSEWTPIFGDGQGGLVCRDSWGHKESDTTEWLNWLTDAIFIFLFLNYFISARFIHPIRTDSNALLFMAE